jgi:pyruvate/2-oxoglutarate/acetoin dehydrogenase E1 component
MMAAAIRSPDPVVVMEPKRLYRSAREEVSDDLDQPGDLEHAEVVRSGADVTLATYGSACRSAWRPPTASRATASTPR